MRHLTRLQLYWLLLILLLPASQPRAEEAFLRARCEAPFPESMSYLQELIKQQGYVVSRVQHVDKGLKSRGYQTGLYRVVFFGKKKEIRRIREQFPFMIPYIPLSITIFEDGAFTGISTIDPISFKRLFKAEEIRAMANTWHKDMVKIVDGFKRC